MIDSLVEKLEKKVVLADGAMGTYFSQKYMTEMEAESQYRNPGADHCHS